MGKESRRKEKERLRRCERLNQDKIMRIEDFILEGPDNAIRTKELAKRTGLSPRDVLQAVQIRRRAGVPILSRKDAHGGLYLAEDAEQLMTYCRRLAQEEAALRQTRKAMEGML